jgi:hypothetical protein
LALDASRVVNFNELTVAFRNLLKEPLRRNMQPILFFIVGLENADPDKGQVKADMAPKMCENSVVQVGQNGVVQVRGGGERRGG